MSTPCSTSTPTTPPGRLGRKAVAVIAFDPAKYDAGSDEKPAVCYVTRRVYNEQHGRV